MNTPTTVRSTDKVGDTYNSTRWGVYSRRFVSSLTTYEYKLVKVERTSTVLQTATLRQ